MTGHPVDMQAEKPADRLPSPDELRKLAPAEQLYQLARYLERTLAKADETLAKVNALHRRAERGDS